EDGERDRAEAGERVGDVAGGEIEERKDDRDAGAHEEIEEAGALHPGGGAVHFAPEDRAHRREPGEDVGGDEDLRDRHVHQRRGGDRQATERAAGPRVAGRLSGLWASVAALPRPSGGSGGTASEARTPRFYKHLRYASRSSISPALRAPFTVQS